MLFNEYHQMHVNISVKQTITFSSCYKDSSRMFTKTYPLVLNVSLQEMYTKFHVLTKCYIV